MLKDRNFENRCEEYGIKYDFVKELLQKGVAIHHAGLFPLIKDIVEVLFAEGLVKVLFATETFAVGINMPAKTVVFNSLRKYDGINFRSLHSLEFYQMSGRAGRRGIDKIGNVIIMHEPNIDLLAIRRLMRKKSEPIESQFKLSYNTILNLINNHNDDEIEIILNKNFDHYNKKSEENVRIFSSYKSKVQNLIDMGYVIENVGANQENYYIDYENKSYLLTDKGKFASKIYAHEVMITELFFTGFYKKFTLEELNIVLSSIIYEERRNDSFELLKQHKHIYEGVVSKLKNHDLLYSKLNKKSLIRMTSIVYLWSTKAEFEDLIHLTNLQDGDVIKLFKQIVDFSRQIRRATEDFELASTIDKSRLLIDRDIVALTL